MIELIGIIIASLFVFLVLLGSLFIPKGGYLFACIYSALLALFMQIKFHISDVAVAGYLLLFSIVLNILSSFLQDIGRMGD